MTLIVQFTLSVEQFSYTKGRLSSDISVVITCYPCIRVKPSKKKKQTVIEDRKVLIELEKSREASQVILLPDVANLVFEFKENDFQCTLDYQLGLQSKNGTWSRINDEIKEIRFETKDSFSLSFGALSNINSDFLFEDGCSQYIKLDWKVFSA